ncbi:YfbM family protein [Paenibacillus sp. UMB4589-SE434]|uniref:YfbM family protein n=1 Tax=Paenibacillus sp. UMB4589-SE434 TaxID=3046314 RepID=UPI00254D7142|nr:YfbM family protein [Paenibacillus sp. UMB4589-SE434]MDK8180140.1 YfbM family protein [Paenibacillus sp. UMB4589-SE434]
MGMRGYYVAMDDNMVQQITAGDIALKSLKIDDYPGLDIDRSWEAIHYLLCGDIADGEPPLGYVVPLTSDKGIDFGSFGAFSLRAEQVAEALLAISELDEAQLRLRYDFPAMVKEEVYPLEPDTVSDEDEDEFFAYMLQNFNEIRRFYSQTVAEGKGLIFYIF